MKPLTEEDLNKMSKEEIVAEYMKRQDYLMDTQKQVEAHKKLEALQKQKEELEQKAESQRKIIESLQKQRDGLQKVYNGLRREEAKQNGGPYNVLR